MKKQLINTIIFTDGVFDSDSLFLSLQQTIYGIGAIRMVFERTYIVVSTRLKEHLNFSQIIWGESGERWMNTEYRKRSILLFFIKWPPTNRFVSKHQLTIFDSVWWLDFFKHWLEYFDWNSAGRDLNITSFPTSNHVHNSNGKIGKLLWYFQWRRKI